MTYDEKKSRHMSTKLKGCENDYSFVTIVV